MTWGCANCERDNIDRVAKCVHCDEPKPKPEKASTAETCERCGTVDKGVRAFHADDPEAKPDDRGARLCASCWIPALKRRATCAHEWAKGKRNAEKCSPCEEEIDQRQQFREAMAKIEARNVTL